jgi:hypothetical protein
MKLISIPDLAGKVKRMPQEWVRWLILACYIGVLYFMAWRSWQVHNFLLVISIFVALAFFVLVSFKLLQRGEKAEDE